MKKQDLEAVLYALFLLSRATLPADAGAIGRLVGLTSIEAAIALIELERAGLVDASRARLTMTGLAKAVGSRVRAGGVRLNERSARELSAISGQRSAFPDSGSELIAES